MNDEFYTSMGRSIASAIAELARVDQELESLRVQGVALNQQRRELTVERQKAEEAITNIKSNIYDVVYVPHE